MSDFTIVRRSQINGEFLGFNDKMLFPLIDGTFWVQLEYKYWYHYAYRPVAIILQKNGRTYIQADNTSEIVEVRQVFDVINSRIDGEFNGWDGESTYELRNGQVWQQSNYKYEYKYAYMPEVLIYNPGGGTVMHVAGTSANVRRVR